MKRYFKTLMLALALMPLAGRADQLAWISRADVEKVVKSIQEQIRQRQGEPYYMVSCFAVLARYSNWSAMSASNGSTSRRMRSARRKRSRKRQPSVASHRRTERISFRQQGGI